MIKEFKPQEMLETPISNVVGTTNPSEKEETCSSPHSSNASTPTNSDQTNMHSINTFNVTAENVSSPINILSRNKTRDSVSAEKQDRSDLEENIDDYDEISFPDISASSMSTPTPPDEYVIKLQEADVMIEQLRNANRHHRTEVSII